MDIPLVLENIFKPNKVKNKPKLNIDNEENLNMGQIIDDKNKDKKKENENFSLSTKNKDNNQYIKYDIKNTQPKPLKYSNFIFNNKCKEKKLVSSISEKNLLSKNKINNNKFNTIDNSSNIIQNNQISNFSNHKN